MQHLITQNKEEIISILNDFFLKGYTRKSNPEFMGNYDKELFDIACRIYKRGFLSQTQSFDLNHSTPLPTILSQFEFFKYMENSSSLNDFYFIDQNLFLKQPSLANFLKGKNYLLYTPQETTKNLETVFHFIETLPNVTNKIYVFGGGIILDIVGFVSGLLNKQVCYLPSTLLSSVDAGIGGKTGVNFFPYGKNQVGLFYEACKLFCIPEFFLSLSHEEVICGLVEAIKHSWIFGEFLNDQHSILRIYHKNLILEDFSYLVSKSIKYKSTIVNQDLFESKDIRTSLNFGHTFAHILEALAEDHSIEYLPHGIAVAHGMHFIFQFGFVEISNEHDVILNLLKDITLCYPIRLSKNINTNQIEKYLVQDKKNEVASHCLLSLPSYGHFSTQHHKQYYTPVTQKFSLKKVTKFMFDYIQSFS